MGYAELENILRSSRLFHSNCAAYKLFFVVQILHVDIFVQFVQTHTKPKCTLHKSWKKKQK